MKKITKGSVIIVSLVFILISSCSIEKRIHLPGYNISFHKKIENKKEKNKSNDVEFSNKREVNFKKAVEVANSGSEILIPITSVNEESSTQLTTQVIYYE